MPSQTRRQNQNPQNKPIVLARLRDRKTPRQRQIRLRLPRSRTQEQVHCGIEGDIQGADREVQVASPAEERDGDPDQSSPSKGFTVGSMMMNEST
ncbi:hypothetical protein LOK49_LG01G01262 [Camellia lanceoleosa]|uniref:Uncharacterized protein n=1 Tax=Camellia lanceoleosa TaxID=1840588 RepID=A0ACC0J389_9ERIC|nr:hypothetical protein LOK49_LG01G01262 [Camellia lanceoleosa]